MATCIKAVSDNIPPGETVFFRAFFAIPVIIVWLMIQHDLRDGLKTSNPLGHFWRGLIGTSAMGLGFAALGLLPLPEVTAISYAAPVLTVILAAMFLGEKLRVFRLTAVALGLLGVVVILSPRLSVLEQNTTSTLEALGAMMMLTSAVFIAMAQVLLRKLVDTEKTPAIVFYFSVSAALLSLLTIPFGWVMPTPQEAALMIVSGLLGGLGQICLTSSYRYAETAVIAPFEYTSILLAVASGYWFFNEVPTNTVLVGVALVIAAGLIIIYRERQLGLESRQQRKVSTPQG